MIDYKMLILLIFMHWISDFVLQSDDMAKKKSTQSSWLTYHCFVYAVVFVPISISLACWLFATHFIIDYFTSMINSSLWARGETHSFFVSVGFDQFLHMLCLLAGYELLIKNTLWWI